MERILSKPVAEVRGHSVGAAAVAVAANQAVPARAAASTLRIFGFILLLLAIGVLSFVAGLKATVAHAAEEPKALPPAMQQNAQGQNIVYPGKTKLDFEGAQIEGELRNPGEFYFLSRDSEKFDSLVRRRKNFHREMLRDVVLTK